MRTTRHLVKDCPGGCYSWRRTFCVVCGEEFHRSRLDARTCSDRCRKAASRARAKDAS